jgi:hypothetical protein
MPEDWRVELEIEGHGGPRRLVDAARERAVAREAREHLGEQVVVSLDRDRVFAYTATREQAEAAARELSDLATSHGLTASANLMRWHAVEERWESPDVTLSPAEERARLEAEEAAESEAWGHPEWEVRVELSHHRDAVALAKRMEAEGQGVVRRSRYVLVGAATEDDATALAERLRGELPADAKVTAGGSEAHAWAELHRFSWLGGLGT